MFRVIIFAVATMILGSCVSGTFTTAAYVKRDRFGESPVVDMRDMISLNEKRLEKSK